MQPHSARCGEKRIVLKIRPACTDHAREEITHAAQRHEGIASFVFVNAFSVRRYNQRPRALQHHRRTITVDNRLRSCETIFDNVLLLPAEKFRRFAFVRSKDQLLPVCRIISVGLTIPSRENRKRVGINQKATF